MLGIDDADPGVIRQYFQAAVFEHRPGSLEPVQLRFLGDDTRNALYPFGSHQAFQSFQSAAPLRYGQTYIPEGTSVRDALVALYRAADGDNWNRNDSWLSDAPLGEWYGVTTDDTGRVIDLDLSENQLSGVIPAEIGRLTDLTRLSLWGNQLQGGNPARDRQPRQCDPSVPSGPINCVGPFPPSWATWPAWNGWPSASTS